MRVPAEHPLPRIFHQLQTIGRIVIEANDWQILINTAIGRVRIDIARPFIIKSYEREWPAFAALFGLQIPRLVSQHAQAALLETILQIIRSPLAFAVGDPAIDAVVMIPERAYHS